MKRKQAEKILAELGYEIDWNVTGQCEGYWAGTVDAIGRNCIDVDCRGEVVHAMNESAWYEQAIKQVKEYPRPKPCPYPIGECTFHDDA